MHACGISSSSYRREKGLTLTPPPKRHIIHKDHHNMGFIRYNFSDAWSKKVIRLCKYRDHLFVVVVFLYALSRHFCTLPFQADLFEIIPSVVRSRPWCNLRAGRCLLQINILLSTSSESPSKGSTLFPRQQPMVGNRERERCHWVGRPRTRNSPNSRQLLRSRVDFFVGCEPCGTLTKERGSSQRSQYATHFWCASLFGAQCALMEKAASACCASAPSFA